MGIAVHELKNIVTAYESCVHRLEHLQQKAKQIHSGSLTNEDTLRITIPGLSFSLDAVFSVSTIRKMLNTEITLLEARIKGYTTLFDQHGIEY